MPKWLIILLVVFLVMILGCCGGVTTCFFLARKAAKTGVARLQEAAQEAQREAEAARANAERNGAAAPAPAGGDTAAPPANNGAAAAEPAAGFPAPRNAPATYKLPTHFPTDIPIQPGLQITTPTWNNMTGTGAVILSGNVKSDDVVSYYTTNLASNGWTQAANTSIANMTQLQYTKDTRTVVLQITPGDNAADTNVMMVIDKK
jgi:hypothetical protein